MHKYLFQILFLNVSNKGNLGISMSLGAKKFILGHFLENPSRTNLEKLIF